MSVHDKTSMNEEGNWLLYYVGVVCGLAVWFLFLYIAIADVHSFNPLAWNKAYLFCVLYAGSINFFILVGYLGSQGKLPVDNYIKWAEEHFVEPNEYADKKLFEVFFSHYTYVATIGLFVLLAMHTYRDLVGNGALADVLLLIGFVFILVAAIVLYCFCLIKLATKMLSIKSVFVYLIIMLSVFFVDRHAVEIIIGVGG